MGLDQLIDNLDTALRTLMPPQQRAAGRPMPGSQIENTLPLTEQEKRHIAGLMRVNHAGEVCAQALYQGQALSARQSPIKAQMEQAAAEETEHLAWCEQRLRELDSQPSLLNPLWYGGSLLIGIMAGFAGDKLSLGFVAETEKQVGIHLQQHLQQLPVSDQKTKLLLETMYNDEMHHADNAMHAGAMELPMPVRMLMQGVAKLMTKTSYYL